MNWWLGWAYQVLPCFVLEKKPYLSGQFAKKNPKPEYRRLEIGGFPYFLPHFGGTNRHFGRYNLPNYLC